MAMVASSPAVCWNRGPAGFGQITRRFYTLQRVNGTGPSGREEGGGPHRHGIEDSDKIKKNSVERWMAKSNKEPPKRKAPVVSVCTTFQFLVRGEMARQLFSSALSCFQISQWRTGMAHIMININLYSTALSKLMMTMM